MHIYSKSTQIKGETWFRYNLWMEVGVFSTAFAHLFFFFSFHPGGPFSLFWHRPTGHCPNARLASPPLVGGGGAITV